ncbi:MAG: peptidylprolyl isomerase [bacterium]
MNHARTVCWAAGLAALLVILGAQCGRREEELARPDPDAVVMTLGDRTVTARDFLIAFQESHDFAEVAAGQALKDLPQRMEELAKTLGFERDLAERARGAGLDRRGTFQAFRKDVIQDELFQRVFLEEVLKKIQVTEADNQRYYQENRNRLFIQRNTNVYVVQGIRILMEPRGREKAEALAREARGKLESGAPFEAVAQTYSDAPAEKRGKENEIPPGLADPEIERRLMELKDGQVSEVFEAGNQFFIFKRLRFVPPEYIPYEEARPAILATRTQELQNQGVFLYAQELKLKHGLLVNLDWLKDTAALDPQAVILSIPGVYQLTVGDFERLAAANGKRTAEAREEYLSFLTHKALFLAEALGRGWGENEIAPALAYWEQHQLAQDYILSAVDKRGALTEEQMRAFYEQNRTLPDFQTPNRYDLHVMFFSAPVQASTPHYDTLILFQKAEAEANRAYAAMREGLSFEEALTQLPQHSSLPVTGGPLGQVALGDLGPSQVEPVKGLEAGEIGRPRRVYNLSKNRFGYEIYYVKDIEPSRPMTYEEARGVIGRQVVQSLTKEIRDALMKSFLEAHPARTQPEGMQAVVRYLETLAGRPDRQPDLSWYEEANAGTAGPPAGERDRSGEATARS